MENYCIKYIANSTNQRRATGIFPGQNFWLVYVHCDLGDVTFDQGHTCMIHDLYIRGSWTKIVWSIIPVYSEFKLSVKSYCSGKNFGYMCNVTLTLKIWVMTFGFVMTHPRVTQTSVKIPSDYFKISIQKLYSSLCKKFFTSQAQRAGNR